MFTTMNEQLEGEHDKLKIHQNQTLLKWATWIIARLGGWKGYTSSKKTRPHCFTKGPTNSTHMC